MFYINSILKAWVALNLLNFAFCSPGDRLPEFKDCLHQCRQISCFHNPYYLMQEEHRAALKRIDYKFKRYETSWEFDSSIPFHLTLLFWNCKSNCDYQCQRIITKERKKNGDEVYQFYGKWPFYRVFGIQEFFSAVFSVANFLAHYIGYQKIKNCQETNPQEKACLNPMMRNVKLVAIVTMCAWVCSTVFHIRDFFITERLDYYFAGLTVFTGCYAIGFRYLRLYQPSRRLSAWFWNFLCLGAYCAHIHRLTTDWSYTYNMRANIFVGILQNIMWGLTCFSLYTKFYERETGNDRAINLTHLNYIQAKQILMQSFFAKSSKLFSLYPLVLCGIVILGMSLEIFDFPPILGDLVDAHSLWHLVTVFPALFGWYDWMLWDINENVWDDLHSIKTKKDQ